VCEFVIETVYVFIHVILGANNLSGAEKSIDYEGDDEDTLIVSAISNDQTLLNVCAS
jgi:hypothetical protein